MLIKKAPQPQTAGPSSRNPLRGTQDPVWPDGEEADAALGAFLLSNQAGKQKAMC